MNDLVARRLRSAQLRTTAIAMITVVVLLGVGALTVVRIFEGQQLRQVDRSLRRASELIGDDQTRIVARPSPDDLAQVVDQRGKVVYATDRLLGKPAAWTPAEGSPSQHRTVRIDGVGSVRIVAVPFHGRWLLLFSSLSSLDQARSSLRLGLGVALPLLALALAVVVWLVVGRTLRPVRSSIEREERLVADVTHELRSPLAGLRALLETEPDSAPDLTRNRADALGVLDRLEALTDGLLTLARQGGPGVAELLDLDDVVLRAAEVAPGRDGVAIDVSAVAPVQVRGHGVDLVRLVASLLDNGVRHAASTVRVSLAQRGDVAELRIADDGPGIPVADHDRVFDRFTRLDDARSRDGGGAGLGLSIVRAVATAHGGSVDVADAPGGGAAFTVLLPTS